MKDNQLSALLFAQAVAGENRVIHRVLTDAESRVVFRLRFRDRLRSGNKEVQPRRTSGRRSVPPLIPTKDSAPLRAHKALRLPQINNNADTRRWRRRFTRAARQSRIGCEDRGRLKVTLIGPSFVRNISKLAPRDFTLDAVSLAVKSYELMIDGLLIGKRNRRSDARSLLGSTFPTAGGSSSRSFLARDTRFKKSACSTTTGSSSNSTASFMSGPRGAQS